MAFDAPEETEPARWLPLPRPRRLQSSSAVHTYGSAFGRRSFADATAVMRQDDSGAALQRIRRLLVQVRDCTRVFEDVVTHDKFWIGKRCRLESKDMGTASRELPAGRTREMEVQEGANCLDVIPLSRAIGLIFTNGHDDALRALPHRARAAFRASSLRCSGLKASMRALPPFLPPLRPRATACGSFLRAMPRSLSLPDRTGTTVDICKTALA
jgi:hypothetical protein